MTSTPTTEQWLEATAVKTLDMNEMDTLVEKSVEAWSVYDEKKKLASVAFAEAEQIDAQILKALKDAGKTKYHVDGIGTISLSQKAVVRVPSSIESKKEFFKYLRTLGEDVLFSMTTVNSNTLNSWYGAQLEEVASKGILGFSVPGIEEPTMRESLRFNSERKKANVKTSSEEI